MADPTRDLVALRTEVRQRSDQVGSTFVTDAEIDSWINQSATDLWDVIVDHAGPDAFALYHDFTTATGEPEYELPVRFYKLLGVDVTFGGITKPIKPYTYADRNRFQHQTGWTGASDVRYQLAGRYGATGRAWLRFLPEPPPGFDVRVWYIPIAFDVVVVGGGGGGSVTPGPWFSPFASGPPGAALVSFNGWDEYVVADVCAKIAEKEESDSRPFIARREMARSRIISAAVSLDSAEPRQMRDVSHAGLDDYEPLWRS